MNEVVGLGVADADSRWINIRRHQAVLSISGLVVAGDWTVRATSPPIEGIVGIALLVAALPLYDTLTGAEWLHTLVGFLCRSHWFVIEARRAELGISICSSGDARFRAYALRHRGRLDLSGRDVDHAYALIRFADGLATGDRVQHFSLHTVAREQVSTTFLVLPPDAHAPEGWLEENAKVFDAVGALDPTAPSVMLERWGYVRDTHELAKVVRIRDFTAAPEGRALLEEIQGFDGSLDVVLHVDVMASTRANRVAARAVHRGGSDDATSQAAGFRRSARSGRVLERVRQRESQVASGRALLRIGVYCVIRAQNIDELHARLTAFYRIARDAGLRCERGNGVQARWYRSYLPGGLQR